MFATFALPIARLVALSSAALPGKLVACAPIANDALKGEALPVRLKLLNWGDNQTVSKGVVKVGAKTVAALAANQSKFGFDEVALDYNHNSLPSHPHFQPDPRKVAGYGKPEVIEGDGLYITALSYTPSGTENAREYRDLSPTPLLDDDGEVIFLHSVALCPQGEVKGLSFYSTDFLKPLSPLSMNYKQLLLTLLSLCAKAPKTKLTALSAEATDAEIQTAVEAASEELGKPADEEKDQKPEGAPTALSALTKALEDQGKLLTALSGRMEAKDREAITAEALSQGKLIPLSAKDLSLDQFRAIVAELPKDQVPVDRRTPVHVEALAVTGGGTAEEEVRNCMGISKDDWAKA